MLPALLYLHFINTNFNCFFKSYGEKGLFGCLRRWVQPSRGRMSTNESCCMLTAVGRHACLFLWVYQEQTFYAKNTLCMCMRSAIYRFIKKYLTVRFTINYKKIKRQINQFLIQSLVRQLRFIQYTAKFNLFIYLPNLTLQHWERKKTKMTFAFKQNQSGVNIAYTLRL